MSIAEFIQDKIFRPRVQKTGCLVVYDPDGHYQNLCNTLADEKLIVVDVSKSSIESRIAAIQGLRDVVEKQLTGMLVYIPKKLHRVMKKSSQILLLQLPRQAVFSQKGMEIILKVFV